MIRYLIKNNFKLMFRNTWSVVVMILGPILVIAVLSSAFAELMKSYEGVEEFSIGYRLAEDTTYVEEITNVIKTAGKEAGIFFYAYPEGDIEEVVKKNDLAGFVEILSDSYVVYTSGDYEVEGIILEYFMNQVVNDGVKASLQGNEQVLVSLSPKELAYMPSVDSKDYYGIIYIVYFCWCGMICATGVLGNEKKYGIARRFQVSGLSEFQNYIGKYIPIVLTVSVGMAIATVSSIVLYDIHWGKPVLSVLIVFGMILAGSAFGMMLYNLSESMVITIIVLFTTVWFMGFFGGSFETYMFSSISDFLKQLSPIYHGNRALVELSCMGESDYVGSALIYSLAITVICSGIAMVAGNIRKRGRA